MKPKIYWRLNAHRGVGLGHLIRCLAMAEMMIDTFESIFLIKVDQDEIGQMITDKGFHFFNIPLTITIIEEPKFIGDSFLIKNEIIVLDGYDFDTAYQKEIKKYAGRMVCIDDINDCFFLADAVINHAGGLSSADYQGLPSTTFYLGLEYLMLRKEFLTPRENSSYYPAARNQVMISLGGEDPNNDLLKVLKICEQSPTVHDCHIVLGPAYRHHECLIKYCAGSTLKIQTFQNLSATAMKLIMHNAEVAICAPSTVSLEYLTCGGQLYLYQTADNQNQLYKYLIDNNLAFPLQQLDSLSTEQLELAARTQESVFDGKSNQRIISVFQSLQQDLDLRLRLAKADDIDQYFTWTNDLETRRQSFNSSEILYCDHQNWFAQKINSPETIMLVLHDGKSNYGQIRFEIEDSTATINFSLDNKARGKGWSKILIQHGIIYLQRNFSHLKEVVALVKKDNLPSKKTFERLKFLMVEKTQQQNQLQFIYLINQA